MSRGAAVSSDMTTKHPN